MDKQAYEGWKKTVIASNKQTKAKGLEAFPCFILFSQGINAHWDLR